MNKEKSMKNKLLFVVNVDWFFISHRLIIAEETVKKGFEVIVACEDTGRSNEITNKGIKFIDFIKLNYSAKLTYWISA